MNHSEIAVVGATGKTGARVLTRLQQLKINSRALSRHRVATENWKFFDWADRDSWKPALEGVDAAYVTYFPDLAVPQAEPDIREFVAVARSVGVQHLVLLSGRGEEGAQRAEDVVRQSGLDWNIVRASWFMQNFSESFMLEGLQSGQLILPQPKAREPFIDVDDIADVALAALTREELRNRLLEITGPDILSFEACVQSIAEASDRDIGFQTLEVEEYLAAAREEGLPEDIAWLMNELFVHVLDGRNESTTETVFEVLGRPARSFSHYVGKTAASGIWSGLETPQLDQAVNQ